MNLLKINNLNIYYRKFGKKKYIVSNFNFSIDEGEIVAINGPSGTGKTSIAKCIIGLHKLYEGKINYHINRDKIEYIFQDPYSSLNPYTNVSYIITEGMNFSSKEEKDNKVIEIMNLVNLDINKRFCYPSDFSGGERQKIAIARALIRKPKLIIADEITSSIDYYSKIMIVNLLKDLQKRENFSCILISHDQDVINKLTDKIVRLN